MNNPERKIGSVQAVPESKIMENFLERFKENNKQLNSLKLRLNNIADYFHGENPQSGDDGDKAGVPNSMLARLDHEFGIFKHIKQCIEDEIKRLEAL